MKAFLFLLLFFSLPLEACTAVRGNLTDTQVTTGLYAICASRFEGFDPSYCQLYATKHYDTQGCISALSAPYGFVAYASVFGELVEPVLSDIQLLNNINQVLQVGLMVFSLFGGFATGLLLRW